MNQKDQVDSWKPACGYKEITEYGNSITCRKVGGKRKI